MSFDHQTSFVCGPAHANINPIWRTVAILKIGPVSIIQQCMARLWSDWCSNALWDARGGHVIESGTGGRCQLRAAAILDFVFIISATEQSICTKFGMEVQNVFAAGTGSAMVRIYFLQNSRWRTAAILKKLKLDFQNTRTAVTQPCAQFVNICTKLCTQVGNRILEAVG